MVELDLTNTINRLCEGKSDESEQKILGIIFKSMITKNGVKPNYNEAGKPYCFGCNQPLNTKMKGDMHVHQYCKCCGLKIDWEKDSE